MEDRVAQLDTARRTLAMSVTELWWRYFALGGMSTELEVDALLHTALIPTGADCDLLAVALNERFSELGKGYPLPYSDDEP